MVQNMSRLRRWNPPRWGVQPAGPAKLRASGLRFCRTCGA